MVAVPRDLPPVAKTFFKNVTAQFELSNEPHKVQILAEAAKVVATIHELDKARRDHPLVVPGSRPGTKQVHPLIDECRRQRQLLAVLVGKLGLPEDVGEDEEAAARDFRVARAKHAARARWSARTA